MTRALKWFDQFIAVTSAGIRKEGYLWRGFCSYWVGSLEGLIHIFAKPKRCRTGVSLLAPV